MAETRQWSTPPYRPNRAEVWPESFIYMRIDGLPKHPDSDEAIEQLIHFHTIEYDGGHTPTPYLRFDPFGTSAWNAGGSAGYFVDVMPPEIEGAQLNTYMRTWRHQDFNSTSAINAQTGELDRHYWHPSMRQQGASKDTTEWLHTDLLGLPYMIGNHGDRHSIMYVPQARALVECIGFMGTYNPLFPGSPSARSVVTWDLDSYILPLGYTNKHPAGVTATRVPVAPFFFTYDDLMDAAQNPDGDLGHALIFAVANYNNEDGKGNSFYWPFRKTDGTGHDGPLLAGSWMRLRSDYPVDSLPTEWLKVLARTLQRYGCLIFDKNHRHAKIITCVDPKWPTSNSPDFFNDRDLFHLSNLELVDVSSVAPENPNDMRPLSLGTPPPVVENRGCARMIASQMTPMSIYRRVNGSWQRHRAARFKPQG